MHIQFVKQPDLARERRQLWAVSGRKLLRYPVYGLVALAAGVLVLANSRGDASTPILYGYLVLVALLMFLAPWYAVWRTMRRNRTAYSRPVRFDITDDEITATGATSRVGLSWAGIARVEEYRGFLIGRLPKRRIAFAVPLECLTPEETAELRGFLIGRHLLPATYRL